MKNKTKFFFASFAILGLVLFFVYFLFKDKKQKDGFNEGMEKINAKEWEQTSEPNLEEDEGIAFELSLFDRCSKGEWIEVRNLTGSVEPKELSGILVGVENAGEISYKLEKFEKKLDFGRPEFGEFLEDRNILIAATETETETEILVYKVKCTERVVTEEIVTNESVLGMVNQKEQFEFEVMRKLASEINTLTKKDGNWEVESFLWPSEEYVYVEFATSENDAEQIQGESLSDDEAESFLLLLKVNKENQEIVTNEIALLKINSDDQWVAERGKDIFQNVDNGRLFSFDFALGKWVKIN